MSHQTVRSALLQLHRLAAFWLLLTVALAGCALGQDYFRTQVMSAPAWRTPTDGAGSLADLTWWRFFQDPALQALIRSAIGQSKDLRLAFARVAEARARLGITALRSSDRSPGTVATSVS